MVFDILAVHACGPDFPNWLLDGSDSQILSAPIASFAIEIGKMDLPVSPYSARPSKRGQHAIDSRDAELADLAQALSQSGRTPAQANAVVEAHAAEREKLLGYLKARQRWETKVAGIPNNTVPPPVFPDIRVLHGLPREFADYFRGALAWQAGDTNGARIAWSALLKLPAVERPFKSTWAAYMLGRSWEETRPGKAEGYYQSVRRYVDEGMVDRAGLAAASLGREALIHYRAGHCNAAIELYLQQAAAGDPGALISLRFTAADALWNRHRSLRSLARNPVSRRVITAYLVSNVMSLKRPVHLDGLVRETAINTLAKIKYFRNAAPGWHRYEQALILWLEAVESADVEEVEEAGLLALAAYQAGEFDTAERWLEEAPEDTLSLWLRAKLLLREGEVDQAAACLASIVRSMREGAGSDADRLRAAGLDGPGFEFRSARGLPPRKAHDEALGELGVLLLVQSEYVEALDALLRSGFWMDAAYVAERVLTVEELKSYVELHWADLQAKDFGDGNSYWKNSYWQRTSDQIKALEIRYLLARRLARLNRRAEARPFYPESLRPCLDALDASLQSGRDAQVLKSERAAALWAAAQILRTNGMELVATEVEPDWAIHSGSFKVGVAWGERTNSMVLQPTAGELQRAQKHGVPGEERFHYRYLAAELAWEAAALMPNNTDETAHVLYTAGRWLRNRDPKAADLFYKALVNRCRKTALGRAADEKRWFPPLEEIANEGD